MCMYMYMYVCSLRCVYTFYIRPSSLPVQYFSKILFSQHPSIWSSFLLLCMWNILILCRKTILLYSKNKQKHDLCFSLYYSLASIFAKLTHWRKMDYLLSSLPVITSVQQSSAAGYIGRVMVMDDCDRDVFQQLWTVESSWPWQSEVRM